MTPLIRVLRRGAVLTAVATTAFAAAALAASSTAPTAKSPPTIEGKPVVGKTLTAGNGTWESTPTRFTYQWLRCDEKGAACVSISGEASQTYEAAAADVGRTLMVLVTASNADGSTTATSRPTDVVSLAAAPKSTAPPTIIGKAQVGEEFVAKLGTYGGGVPDRFSYQWQRCDLAGSACVAIAGATGQTYGVRTADVGHTIRAAVTATNEFGSDTSMSAATNAIAETPRDLGVTTSVVLSKSVVVCCAAVTLGGKVSTAKAGEPLVVLAREFDDIASDPIGTTTSRADGKWSFTVKPRAETTYEVKTATDTAPDITVRVRPRIGLASARGIITAKVTGRDSFAGKVLLLQRRAGSRWRTISTVVLDARSQARFRVAGLPRGVSLVRAFLTSAQAGKGYLSNTSAIRRIRR